MINKSTFQYSNFTIVRDGTTYYIQGLQGMIFYTLNAAKAHIDFMKNNKVPTFSNHINIR